MGKEKIPHGSVEKSTSILITVFFTLFIMLMAGAPALAVTAPAGTADVRSVIEGVKVRQIGSNQLILELRGTKMSLPVQIDDPSAAAVLEWKDIRFPRTADKQAWWDDYGWDILQLSPKRSNEWWQKYEYPLAQRITVSSNGINGLRLTVIGERPLKVTEIIGMQGSDSIKIQLSYEDVVSPASQAPPRPKERGDSLGMQFPVTLELRDVSVREVFRMLADLRHLNLILDPSVPDAVMTFSFKNTRLSEIFAYMLRMNELTYSLMGGTLVVGSAESIGRTLGRNITKGYKIAYAEPGKIPALIMALIALPRPPVVDERLRTLYITCTPEQHTEVEGVVRHIDHPGKQIMLEARLVEINDGSKQEVEDIISAVYKGWLFSYGSGGLGLEYTYGKSGGKLLPNAAGGAAGGVFNPINIIDPTIKMLDAGLRALESDNKGKVLANPSVVTLDGQKSTIKLTHNYLYQSGTDDKGNPRFSEQETGPTLEITPVLGRDGFVTLKLKISTGEIIQFRKSGTSEAPETTKRELETVIRVRDGELFVIGGLYQENRSKSVSRVPVLGYIPLIGELFKTRSDSHVKSEMAFIVVPHILDIPTGNSEIYTVPGCADVR